MRWFRRGGAVVDLGCGSGRFLGYLAQRRPDLQIVGIELDSKMLGLGRRLMNRLGLENRVTLMEGDMTSFSRQVSQRVSLVSAHFSLHHLPTLDHLRACARQIAEVRSTYGAGVWIFDHARPNHIKTALSFPEAFTPDESPVFKKESSDSIIAAWRFDELTRELSVVDGLHGKLARLLPVYQIHWVKGKKSGPRPLFIPPPPSR